MAIAPISGIGIDAIALYRSLPSVAQPMLTAAPAAGPESFAQMVSNKLAGAVDLQSQGTQAAQALATGTASDVSAATIAVEKAAVSLQLVGAFRNKALEAYQDVMRMQI